MEKLIKKIKSGVLPNIEELNEIERNWYEKILNFNFDKIKQDFVDEYIFHSPQQIQIKMHGINLIESIDMTQEDFELSLNLMALRRGVEWNISKPFVSFDFQNFRATLIHSTCLNNLGHKLFLRTISEEVFHPQDFCFNANQAQKIINGNKNVLIAGSTGSGKSSFINSLLSLTGEDEHIIIAEDTFELKSPHNNCTRFLSKGFNGYSLENYLSYAMRMRPDRIIVGELRSNEVISYLLALNTGHKGVLSTIHANNARDALKRIALLYKLYCEKDIPYSTILKLITQNIDEIIFLSEKKVIEYVKVIGSNQDEVFLEEIQIESESPIKEIFN